METNIESKLVGQKIPELIVDEGNIFVFYAYDIGQSIQLDETDKLIISRKERMRVKTNKRVSKYLQFSPPPLKISQECRTIKVGDFKTEAQADLLLFDFGAVSVSFQIKISGPILQTIKASEYLYGNVELQTEAQRLVAALTKNIASTISRAGVNDHVEDFCIFQFSQLSPKLSIKEYLKEHGSHFARVLRAESVLLAEEEVDDLLSNRISYATGDVSIINWNSAIVIDTEAEDVKAVLEYANVALLELSFLDGELDRALEEFYQLFSHTRGVKTFLFGQPSGGSLKKIGQFSIDSAIVYEDVTNAIKFLGDEFLAKLYRLASKRFGLESWDASIQRKIQTVERIYDKISNNASQRRVEILEWIIIALIAISILLPFVSGIKH